MSGWQLQNDYGPHYIGLRSHDVGPTDPRASSFLATATLGKSWLHPSASNYTFLVELSLDGNNGYAIYKPRDGESPLRDFLSGTLYQREVATFELDRLLGWGMVPPTIIRDGDVGIGSLQLFVPPVPGSNFFSIRDTCKDQLLRMAVFDIVANNADRKGGHCFIDLDGAVWGVDHGLTFHVEPKLRTVIWDFGGESIPEPILFDLEGLGDDLKSPDYGMTIKLKELLSSEEIDGLIQRIDLVVSDPVLPFPSSRRDLPWPWI
jgi:uncharacterized repeat protein (TIGR03843 family)